MTTSSQAIEIVDFSVAYEGPSLDDHAMEVRDLAPALLALAQSVDRANALLNGDRASVSLQVKATEAGSFEIVLQMITQLLDGGRDLLAGQTVMSAVALQALLFGGDNRVSALGLLKWLRGRAVPPSSGLDVNGNITLSIDNLRLSVPPETVRLVTDRLLRGQLESIVEPVLKAGVDRFLVKKNDVMVESVEKDEAEALQPLSVPVVGAPSTSTMVLPRVILRPDTVRFAAKRGRWRLTDGSQLRYYTIEDAAFLREVASGAEPIGARDSLICEVVIDQTLDAAGNLKTEHRIVDVLEHIRFAPSQGTLTLDAGSPHGSTPERSAGPQ